MKVTLIFYPPSGTKDVQEIKPRETLEVSDLPFMALFPYWKVDEVYYQVKDMTYITKREEGKLSVSHAVLTLLN